MEKALKIEEIWSNYCENKTFIEKLSYKLNAIYYLIRGSLRENIILDLCEYEAEIINEVVIRWAWMYNQKLEHSKGIEFKELYKCEVGSNIHRKKLDREFWTLLKFLPAYNRKTSKNYIYLKRNIGEKEEPPDFIIADEKNNYEGVEITEAPVDETYNLRLKERQKFLENFEKVFQNFNNSFSIKHRPSWEVLNKNYDDMQKQLKFKLFANLKNHFDFKYQIDNGILLINVVPSVSFNIWFERNYEGKSFPDFGKIGEKHAAKALIKGINKKLKGVKPKTSPCNLVLYPNISKGYKDLGYLKKIIRQEITLEEVSNHFQQVFIVNEHSFLQIY